MLPLFTKRLALRRFLHTDSHAFLHYRNDPEIARYQSWENCGSLEGVEFIRRQQVQEIGVCGEWLQIAIANRETNDLIGDCGLQLLGPDNRQARFGVTVARGFQGRGYATEALTGLLDYLFREMSLHRVQADVDPQNIASYSLLERLGLRREGHLRQSLWFKGRWADEYLYGILREEWLSLHSEGPHFLSGKPDKSP